MELALELLAASGNPSMGEYPSAQIQLAIALLVNSQWVLCKQYCFPLAINIARWRHCRHFLHTLYIASQWERHSGPAHTMSYRICLNWMSGMEKANRYHKHRDWNHSAYASGFYLWIYIVQFRCLLCSDLPTSRVLIFMKSFLCRSQKFRMDAAKFLPPMLIKSGRSRNNWKISEQYNTGRTSISVIEWLSGPIMRPLHKSKLAPPVDDTESLPLMSLATESRECISLECSSIPVYMLSGRSSLAAHVTYRG